jgi:hypothetical protein
VVSVTPRPRFTLGERTPGIHWTGGLVGPRADLDAGARRKILCPCRESNPNRPARSQTLYCLSCHGFSIKGQLVVYIPFSQSISLRSIVMLSSHHFLDLPSGRLPRSVPTNYRNTVLVIVCCLRFFNVQDVSGVDSTPVIR